MHCVSFLTTEEIGRFCAVSNSWKGQEQSLWKQASINEGVPIVEGEGRNYKDDFRFLRPITISNKVFKELLGGEAAQKIPRMREDRFFELKYSQDFFEPGKLKRETHVVVVDPSALKITVGPHRPLALDATGTLISTHWFPKKKITVPFSFKNLKMLTTRPLAGMENGPVFNPNSNYDFFNQCNAPPNLNKILIMRKAVVGGGMPFEAQKALVTSYGQRVVTVRERALYNAVEILKTGTCPDLSTYARSAEPVHSDGRDYKAAIGFFAPKYGLYIGGSSVGFASIDLGVVSGVFADL
jgi:hypothetical protein